MNDLKREFEYEMRQIYEKAKNECKYRPTRYLQMLDKYGGLKTAKKLLVTDKIHEGLVKLYLFGRLDLTVEKLVLNKKYRILFSEENLKRAKRKLNSLNYSV